MSALDTRAPRLGFQPGLSVGDFFAAHWLAQAALRLRREVAWVWHQREVGAGLAMADPAYEALDLVRFEADRARFFAEDTAARWLSDQIAVAAPAPGGPRGGFGWLAAELRLDDTACLALALALARVLDAAQGAVIAAVLNDAGATRPTPALLQRLADQPAAALDLLDPGHALATHGILDPAPSDWTDPLAISPVVARQLLSPEGAPPTALSQVVPLDAQDHDEEIDLAVARLRTRAAGRAAILPVVGPQDAPLAAASARIAQAVGLDLLQPAGPRAAEAGLGSLMVAAWLRGAALYLPLRMATGPETPLKPLAALPLVVFVGACEGEALSGLPAQIALPRLRLNPLGYRARLDRWRLELPELWAGEAGRATLTECARRFRYEGAAITRVAAAVRALDRSITRHDLFAAARADLDLGDLAQPVAPRFELAELMLPARQADQIAELIGAMEALSTVHHDWGTARAWNESGLSVLFSGAPGTGKTMAAEAIARAVDMPIYRIDLSQVVNKYIGETEKNLRRLFDAADAADVILFFDEADALFGKRTEVKDAHDRYANLEVSYLLERMERFKGMAILATNRKKDLDEAFMRRLRYVVQFPLPGPEERRRIWGAVLPSEIDSTDLDLDFLAERISLSGGHIRSAVFNACLRCAGAEGPPRLTMQAVVRAVKDEFDKLNRAVSRDQFGPHAQYLREDR
jgi:hypothetical protein